MPTVQHRITQLLLDIDASAAAFIVDNGLRTGAEAIADDLVPVGRTVTTHDRVLAELVRAWGAGHDALVAEALAAWDRADCADCAHRVMQGLPSCHDHRAQVAA